MQYIFLEQGKSAHLLSERRYAANETHLDICTSRAFKGYSRSPASNVTNPSSRQAEAKFPCITTQFGIMRRMCCFGRFLRLGMNHVVVVRGYVLAFLKLIISAIEPDILGTRF